MKKPTRRNVIAMAPALVVSTAFPVVAAASEASFDKVRRLGKELAVALAEAGKIEYAYVRPAGADFPVILAGISDPDQLSKFYLREYERAIFSGKITDKRAHIRTLSNIISDMMQDLEGYEILTIRPAIAGKPAVDIHSSVRSKF